MGDGDTIRVRGGFGETQTIRLACIDAAEMSQAPHGEQARQRLQQIIPVGSVVKLKTQTTDAIAGQWQKYSRVIST